MTTTQFASSTRDVMLLQGVAWKNISSRPLDKLLLADLKKELSMRGVSVKGKKKPALKKEFDDIKLVFQHCFKIIQKQHCRH